MLKNSIPYFFHLLGKYCKGRFSYSFIAQHQNWGYLSTAENNRK